MNNNKRLFENNANFFFLTDGECVCCVCEMSVSTQRLEMSSGSDRRLTYEPE